MNEINECDQTLLFLACTTGNIRVVDYLLKIDGLRIDGIQDRVTDSTPLHAANATGNTEIVAMLLARGAVPEAPSSKVLLPEQELAQNIGLDKEKKKKLEELWKSYSKHGKKGIERFLPEGKKLADYKVPERQATVEEIITGLTRGSEADLAPISWVNPAGEMMTIDVLDLLLTYRLYCTPEDLVAILKKRALDAQDNPNEEDIHLRTINFFKHWISKMWYDFRKEDILYTRTETLLQTFASSPIPNLSKIASTIMKTLKEVSKKTIEEPKISGLGFTVRPLGVTIMTYYPLIIVQHLNEIDISLWKQVKPSESWNTKKLEELLKWSNHLKQWVLSEILSGETVTQRVDILNRFFDIAEELYRQSFCNLNSLLSILDSLNKFSNTVLFKGLNDDKKNKYQGFLRLFDKNFAVCCEEIKSRVKHHTPFIPPVAVYYFHGLSSGGLRNLVPNDRIIP
jgi:hypothetical protein